MTLLEKESEVKTPEQPPVPPANRLKYLVAYLAVLFGAAFVAVAISLACSGVGNSALQRAEYLQQEVTGMSTAYDLLLAAEEASKSGDQVSFELAMTELAPMKDTLSDYARSVYDALAAQITK